MNEAMVDFSIEVQDRAGVVGQLTRVILDPNNGILSHIVVVPDDLAVTARLVPIEFVGVNAVSRPQLNCTREESLLFGVAVMYETAPFSSQLDLITELVTENSRGVNAAIGGPFVDSFDVIPEGKVGVRRGQIVSAVDGRVGELGGLVVDLNDHTVITLVVREGHLWSKKQVTLPFGVVDQFANEIRLKISMRQAESIASHLD